MVPWEASTNPLFSTNTVTSRSGGGRGASADCEAIISAVDTSLISSNTDMYTVVYDPDMYLHACIFSHKMYQPAESRSPEHVHLQTGCHRTATRTPNSS
jgi:hypothetical protein